MLDPLDVIKRLDKTPITSRDILVLETIKNNPGQSGNDISNLLGLKTRSSIQKNFPKLITMGLMIDTREVERQAVPARYYITPKGEAKLAEILYGAD